ncbi:MAG TPA: hypothetical protein VFV75_06115 [Candidatus Polarisedimenticolaceae bacterium]|nr:hypothetical protein [Candidatus Polarisedimenticolaceae bacterium]
MRPRSAFAAAAFLVLGALAGPSFADGRACVRANVEEPFLLPDGSWHEAGLLRICLDRTYSPSAALHTIQAAEGTAGTFLSRRGVSEAPAAAAAPRILFARGPSRTLRLMGYAVAQGERTRIYWIRQR